jgi:Protein of unknown function (DUF1501)
MILRPKPAMMSRRQALCKMGAGFGMMSLASILGESVARAAESSAGNPWTLKDPQFKPKAKRVIFLFMNGGMSPIDSFDYKPALEKYNGQPMPGGILSHERQVGGLMQSPFKFKKYGQSGAEVSEIWPHLAECVDDICFVKSVYTEIPNHEPALRMMNTGANIPGRPSMGSWMTYGLGVSNQSLPGFVVLCPQTPTTVGPPLWSSTFLSPMYQGTYVSDKVDKQEFDPKKLIFDAYNERFDLKQQRKELDLVEQLDKMDLASDPSANHDPQLEATIGSMETAYRMQTEAPDVFDVRKESEAVQKLYGEGSTARGCLTAARLIERGVRMVQVYYAMGDPWDHHYDIELHRKTGKDSDQPFAALIKDLKSRGLFDETLIVCGSEFGRTPVVETGGGFGGGTHNGRDHNPHGFTMWLAGGGVKGGMSYGATDDFGWKAVDKPVHVHDIHATILYLLGIEHTKLTYRYSGRDYRLTDVSGNVIHDIIA